MEKALCYVRVSTKSQEEQPRHDEQIRSMKSLCEARKWEYEIIAECFSAKTIEKRKVFSSVLERMERGEAKYLVVHTVDRLSRNSEEAQRLAKQSIKKGWKLVVSSIPDLDVTKDGDWFQFALLTTLAEQEVKVLSTRVREGTQQAKLNNRPVGGERHLQLLDKDTAKKIIYYKYQGLTTKEIAEKLNALGLQSAHCTKTSGKAWNSRKVEGFLNTHNSKGEYVKDKAKTKKTSGSADKSL